MEITSKPVYVLKRERINDEGQIVSQNVGVTFSIHEAEGHKSASFENDFDTLQFSGSVQDQTNATDLILAMRRAFADVEESLS
jgi:hypothetical protein